MEEWGGLYQYQSGVDGCMGVGGSEGTGKGGGERKGELSFPDAVAYHLLATSINYLPPELALGYALA